MKLVNTSVRRPVGVIMIVAAIIALGIMSLRNLTIDLFPDIELPIAVVATTYEGAAPEDVEELVSRPIESAVSSIEGIDTVQSQSSQGSSLVVMMFNTGADLDSALLRVREQVSSVQGMLPETAGEPNVLRFDPQQMPVMWVGLTGDNVKELQNIADEDLVPYFERQDGVASVTVEGGTTDEIQVELNQAKLAQYGLNTQSIMQAIGAANQSGSAGVIAKGDQDLQIRIQGDYESLEDIKQTIVQTPNGATLHLEDIAKVSRETKDQSSVSYVNNQSSVVLSILKKTDGNTVEVADTMHAAVEDMQGELPDGVNLDVVFDNSTFIKMSIDSVVRNMLMGAVFSALILLLFLKSFRATLVIGLSIPIAIISTFSLMYFTGETVNVLTMGGLALGIGMMVDSSIVILENIVSYRQRGHTMKEAAKRGASELAPAVIASTTTTIVVFLPIIFVEGIAAEMFVPLALTISFALLASLVVSVTLIPMLASKLLTKSMQEEGRRYWFDQVLGKINAGYKRVLKFVLGHRKTTVFGTIAAIALSLALIPMIGAEFIPQSDQGQIQINVNTPTGTHLESTEEIADQVDEKLSNYEDVIETNFVTVGGSGGMVGGGGSSNQASYMIQLVPQEDRDVTTTEVVTQMDDDLQKIPGAEITVSAMGGSMGGLGSPVQLQISGPDYDVLKELGDQVVYMMEDVEGIHNPESSASEGSPQVNVNVDRERAAQYGLSYQQVMSQVQMGFTGQIASRYRTGGSELDVRVMLPEDQRTTIEDLETLPIQTQTGALIPLSTVAELEQIQGPSTISRQNQQRQISISSDIVDRDLGSIMTDVEEKLDTMKFPEGYSYSVGGQAQDMAESFGQLSLALIFSIFLVYAVMAVQFENFLHPFVIMFSLPATIVGVIVGLYITQTPLSIPAFIGFIMLAGIVVNNAIVLVDYINILRNRGQERYEAILNAGPSRMRPILMTTLTTVLGMIPLALGLGEGSESQQPLAIVIIFGLTVSAIFTLLLIPVVYTYFDDFSRKVVGWFSKDKKETKDKKKRI
ncbi:efflux RND transporter permease subunit [Virgibacillus sp. MSP4-1]|uniref:efflux RND transporter permease subunit n=1 Tax=Virgibacillus sp. MSP4-1 TaxID=2700081 RepID=UPI00039E9240|nr:efflux RND transporter permease subunit [Virgibacillus sp. MSP4-1]QHS23531.1 efflux RND transporter permease subunit [Virgibacillus sp. MSP4-1]